MQNIVYYFSHFMSFGTFARESDFFFPQCIMKDSGYVQIYSFIYIHIYIIKIKLLTVQ